MPPSPMPGPKLSACQDLFQYRAPSVPGLIYLPDYISPAAEQSLIKRIDAQSWCCDLQRRTQHYGRHYQAGNSDDREKATAEPLPLWLALLARRLLLEGHCPALPDRVSVNEYLPGQGIGAHIDQGGARIPAVMILSLGSSCVMQFQHVKTRERIAQFLERRSLTIIAGEARHLWTHAIPRRQSDLHEGVRYQRQRRISIMFRAAVNR